MFGVASIAFSIAKRLFNFAEKRASDQTERLRIKSGVDIEKVKAEVELAGVAASVVKTGMEHKVFWIPWLMAAVPTELWFGWGVMDSLFNGALPDVATLPPQLLAFAEVVHSNIFYTGAIGLVGSGAMKALQQKWK